MEVISAKYLGLLHVCAYCGALLRYGPQDVYEGHYLYCPVCKEKQECALQKDYDGAPTQEEPANDAAKTISC